MISHSTKLLRALVVFAALALTAVANAQLTYRIAVNTSSLVGNPAGPFSLDFQLNDGSAVGDGNNWATLNHFQFGGGSAVGGATTFGGATGNLTSGISLADTDWSFNELYQGFLPGSWLTFDLTLSTHVDLGGTPDSFSFAILDGNLMNLPTLAPGTDALIQIDIDGASPAVATYASLDGLISVSATPVPEASTYGLCGLGLLALVALKRRFRR